ncbi:MAG: AbrB/MazE/SpoVT family DNA-binding domain-containing protein [Patescibacteria group bacterium]
MQYTTSVTQKGQTTIPIQIRKKLGINMNSKIVFEIKENNEVLIRPTKNFFELKGSIKSKKPFNIEAMDNAIKRSIKTK